MARSSTTKKSTSIVSVPWRDGVVFLCPDGCGYAHEREDRVEQHVRAGRHMKGPKEAPSRGTTATEPNAEATVAQEPEDDAAASTSADEGGEQ